jgi:hypothetical protein
MGVAFEKAVRRKPLAFAVEAGYLWNFNRFSPGKPCQNRNSAKG